MLLDALLPLTNDRGKQLPEGSVDWSFLMEIVIVYFCLNGCMLREWLADNKRFVDIVYKLFYIVGYNFSGKTSSNVTAEITFSTVTVAHYRYCQSVFVNMAI